MIPWIAGCLLLLSWSQGTADWEELWSRVEQLKSLSREDPVATSMARELLERVPDGKEDARHWLLEAELERWAGRDPGILSERLAETPVAVFSGREAWLLAEVLPPGLARVRAVMRALDQTPSLSQEALLFTWNVSVEEARELRFADGALPIHERLHQRYRAAWSAGDLSRTLALLGRIEDGDAVLAEAIALEEAAGRPATDLWSQRGIQVFGAGDERRGRDYLGHALGQGSKDAVLVLGREDLTRGRLEAARKGFRASILSGDDTGWALRGWGGSLLPGAHARASRPTLGPRAPTPPK